MPYWRSSWLIQRNNGICANVPFLSISTNSGSNSHPTSDYEWDCIQNSFTISPDHKRGMTFWEYLEAMAHMEAALQPQKDLDRGWPMGPEPAENHPLWAMAAMPIKATLILWGAVRLCHWEIHIGRVWSCFITNPPWLT